MSLYLEQGESRRPSSCTRRSRRRCAKAISFRCASCRRETGAGVARAARHHRQAAAQPDRRQSAAVPQGRGRQRPRSSMPEPDPEQARARARVQGRDRSVRRQARRVPRAPGHGDAGHAALHRRRAQAVQGRPPVHAAGRQERRGRARRCPATSPRWRRSTRSSSTACCTTRTTRTTSTCAARVPDADARRRDRRRRSAATSSGSPTCCTG